MRLKDRVAIVVGAGQSPGEGIGNGRATALTFAREGAKVLCVDHNLASAQETVDLIAETEGKPSKLEPLAKAILRGAREMVRELAMSDATFAELEKALGRSQVIDLALAIAFYNGVVRMLGTLQIDVEPEYQKYLEEHPLPG